MKLWRLPLPRAALDRLTKPERAFLLLAGHMQNELNSLHKVFAWCLHNKSPSEIESLANGTQAQIYARLLAGKLLEAWNAVRDAYFGTKISKNVEGALHLSAQKALTSLKAYFGKSNALYDIRNSFAFHYSAEEIEHHWIEVAEHPNFEVILGGTVGNNLYLASELMVNAAVLNSAGAHPQPVAEMYFDEIQSTASQFTTFLEGAILVLLERALSAPLGSQRCAVNISPQLRFEEVAIPYFYDHGLPEEAV